MICPPRCQCEKQVSKTSIVIQFLVRPIHFPIHHYHVFFFPSVAGLYYKFDLTPMLRSVGVSEDTIASYEEGDVMKVSQELRYIHPDLHPEMGVADTTATNLEHLLGPEADWDQVRFFPFPLSLVKSSLEM